MRDRNAAPAGASTWPALPRRRPQQARQGQPLRHQRRRHQRPGALHPAGCALPQQQPSQQLQKRAAAVLQHAADRQSPKPPRPVGPQHQHLQQARPRQCQGQQRRQGQPAPGVQRPGQRYADADGHEQDAQGQRQQRRAVILVQRHRQSLLVTQAGHHGQRGGDGGELGEHAKRLGREKARQHRPQQQRQQLRQRAAGQQRQRVTGQRGARAPGQAAHLAPAAVRPWAIGVRQWQREDRGYDMKGRRARLKLRVLPKIRHRMRGQPRLSRRLPRHFAQPGPESLPEPHEHHRHARTGCRARTR